MVKVSRLGTGLVALTPCKPSGYSSMLVPNDCLDVAGIGRPPDQIQRATAATAENEPTVELDRPCNA